jgi:hypothetical protein
MNSKWFAYNTIARTLCNYVNRLRINLQFKMRPTSLKLCCAGPWIALLGCLLVSAAHADTAYVLGSNGNLWREHGTAAHRTLVDTDVVAFQGLEDNYTVYVLHPNLDLWRESGTQYDSVLVDQNVIWFQDVP